MAQTLQAIFLRGDDQSRYNYTPGANVVCGQVIDIGDICGICTSPEGIASGALGSLATRGQFRLKKNTGGNAISYGAKVYWDTANSVAVNASGANIVKIGVCVKAAVAGDDGVECDLNTEFTQ